MPKRSLQRVIEAYEQLRLAIRLQGERAGALAAQELTRFAQEIVRIVGAGTNGRGTGIHDEAHLQALKKEIDGALARFASGDQIGAVYAQGWREVQALVKSGTPAAFTGFGRTTASRLKAAEGAMLDANRAQWPEGFRAWVGRFQEAGNGLKNDMKDLLVRAQLDGWDQATLAKNMLRNPKFQFANLPKLGKRAERVFSMSGTLSPSDALVRRAHVIARTELAGVSNRMHRNWTQAAGLDLYINVNAVPVSQECKEANLQEPMSWDDWAAWTASNGRGGLAPRHPNCDSLLLAVPASYVGEATSMVQQRRGGNNG